MIERGRSTNIANGILSAIVLACGIILSVLVGLLFKKLVENGSDSYTYSAYTTTWAIGFAFIIPGLIGVIASLVGQKGGFITQMVLCILTLVIMGIFFIIGILALFTLSLFSYSTSGCLGSANCEGLNDIAGMAIGATVMIVIGWIVCLIATITGGILACSQETPGVVVHQYGPGMQMGHMAGPQAGYVVQPGYWGQPGYGGQQGYVAHPGGGHPGYAEKSGHSSGSTKHPSYDGDNRGYM